MGYTIYYKNSRCKIPDYSVNKSSGWPKDTTQISFSRSDNIISYSITNLTSRTQYLFDNNLLGIGVFVEENPNWLNRHWRSKFAKQTHRTSHCLKVFRVNNLTGSIDLNNVSNYKNAGCLSHALYHLFWISSDYQDPYVATGTENVALGIGRMYDIDETNWLVSSFRPYKVSEYQTIEVENTYGDN